MRKAAPVMSVGRLLSSTGAEQNIRDKPWGKIDCLRCLDLTDRKMENRTVLQDSN
jgi:hypothetical protein